LILIDAMAVFLLVVGVVELEIKILHVLCDTVYFNLGLVDGDFWIHHAD